MDALGLFDQALFEIGKCFSGRGDYGHAREVFKDMVAKFPESGLKIKEMLEAFLGNKKSNFDTIVIPDDKEILSNILNKSKSENSRASPDWVAAERRAKKK